MVWQKKFQPGLVAKHSKIKVGLLKKVNLKVYWFYDPLGNSCPKKDNKLRIGKMADSKLIQVAVF